MGFKYYYGHGKTVTPEGWYRWSHTEGPWDTAAEAAAHLAVFVKRARRDADLLLDTPLGLRILSRVAIADQNYSPAPFPSDEEINKHLATYAARCLDALENILPYQDKGGCPKCHP